MSHRDRKPFTMRLPNGGTLSGPDEAHVREGFEEIQRSADRAAKRDAHWGRDNREQMSRLAASFPRLNGAPGSRPWNQDLFLKWLCSTGLSHGELLAARFVLGVWNASTDWAELAREEGHPFPENAARFDLHEAMGIWDRTYVNAMLQWIELPFWP